MWSQFSQFVARWFNQLVGYRVTEKEILDWMADHGYVTSAAKLTSVQLYALQRPGWVQVFRFQVEARDTQGQSRRWFGALRSDERYGEPQIKIFPTTVERDQQLQQWSSGLIVRR